MKAAPTRAHAWVFKAVFGAVRNTMHGHPRWRLNEIMAGSIAKRATGTLTAGWPDVLAAPAPSDSVNGLAKEALWPPHAGASSHAEGGRRDSRRPPFRWKLLHNTIGAMAGAARAAGNAERERALVEVLRLMARMRQ